MFVQALNIYKIKHLFNQFQSRTSSDMNYVQHQLSSDLKDIRKKFSRARTFTTFFTGEEYSVDEISKRDRNAFLFTILEIIHTYTIKFEFIEFIY